MGLWARFKRVFFASTGAALDKIENPELVLQQTIRDMRDRVPELNNSVAQVMATERLLIKNHENLEKQVVDLDSKIKASVKWDGTTSLQRISDSFNRRRSTWNVPAASSNKRRFRRNRL